jgi:hypothetical protein
MSDVRLHIQFAREARIDGGVAECRARGRALQRYTGLSCSHGQRGGEDGEGERALRDSPLLLATGHGRVTAVEKVVHGGQHSR